MRVAVLFASETASYSDDLLVAGLRSVVGVPNVGWAPHKDHLACASVPRMAPEATCWFGTPDKCFDTNVLTEDVGDRQYDLVIVSNPGRKAPVDRLNAAIRLIEVAESQQVPVILVDGNDFPDRECMEALLPSGPWLLRECKPVDLNDSRIWPFPLCVNTFVAPRVIPWSKRMIDVLWGGTRHYGRGEYVDALKLWRESTKYKVNIVESRSLDYSVWNDMLSSSKTCICLTGAGRATYRYFEAPIAGVVSLVQEHGLMIPNDFVEIVSPRFKTPAEMIQVIERELSDDRSLKHKAEEVYEQAWQFHTMQARSAQILSQLGVKGL